MPVGRLLTLLVSFVLLTAVAVPGATAAGSDPGTKTAKRCHHGYVRKHGHCVRRHRTQGRGASIRIGH